MNPGKYSAEIDNANAQIKFQKLVIGGLLVGYIFGGMITFSLIGKERTILVPPTVQKTFWVDSEKVSSEYLEQMSYFIAQLVLTATPETAGYQGDTLIKYAAPEDYGALKARVEANVQRLRKDNASSLFNTRSMSVDEKGMRVAITGMMGTFIADKKVTDTQRSFLLEFVFRGGKLYLKSFQETNPNDPFNTKISAAATAAPIVAQ